jgi:hypothetical protein
MVETKEQVFAVATFDRVFDNTPLRDVITLEQLARGLRRFVVKPKTRQSLEKSEKQIEAAWKEFQEGKASSAIASALGRAAAEAEAKGEDPKAAAEDHYEHLLSNARAAPKRDLRLWSPALYMPDTKRGGENVIHLSCLVLDYDEGSSIENASATWQDYFHLLHTTFSHRPERPKFRLILPLAEPVPAAEWHKVYEWAQERTGHTVDPTGKSIGSTFALPQVPDKTSPRVAWTRPGPLLDPVLEGLIAKAADPPPKLEAKEPNHFRIPIANKEVVEGSFPPDSGDAPSVEEEEIDPELLEPVADEDWLNTFPWDKQDSGRR